MKVDILKRKSIEKANEKEMFYFREKIPKKAYVWLLFGLCS